MFVSQRYWISSARHAKDIQHMNRWSFSTGPALSHSGQRLDMNGICQYLPRNPWIREAVCLSRKSLRVLNGKWHQEILLSTCFVNRGCEVFFAKKENIFDVLGSFADWFCEILVLSIFSSKLRSIFKILQADLFKKRRFFRKNRRVPWLWIKTIRKPSTVLHSSKLLVGPFTSSLIDLSILTCFAAC